MTEDEIKRWNTLIEKIKADITYYEMREVTADHDEDAYAWGQSAHVLEGVIKKIHDIVYDIVADQYTARIEKDIASMEQGTGGE